MGANLCCMARSTSSNPHHKHLEKLSPPPSSSYNPNIITSCCMQRDYYLPSSEKKAMKVCKLTLEEWLLSSPGMKAADSLTGGELHVFRQFSKRVHPSSSRRVHAELISSAPGESFSMDRIDGGDDKTLEPAASLSRSKSGKKGRTVSFRWPEAEVVMFYSPEETYEEGDHEDTV